MNINMETKLQYTIIKTEKQYFDYCNKLEELVFKNIKSSEDQIELLTLLIEKWDSDNFIISESDPIKLLKSLMKEHNLKAKDLTEILDLSKGTISKILNYRKGISKETIRKLSKYFSLRQEAFNRPYKLKDKINNKFRNAALMNTTKTMVEIV